MVNIFLLHGSKLNTKVELFVEIQTLEILFIMGQPDLCDKLIRRTIYLKSIIFMKNELYDEDYHKHTDDTIYLKLFILLDPMVFLNRLVIFII